MSRERDGGGIFLDFCVILSTDMRKVINAHCHIYPAKVAERAVEGIKAFYGLEGLTSNGMTDDLIRDGEKVGTVHYLVHSVATTPLQIRSINEFIASEVRSHEGLFTGFGTLHPSSSDIRADLQHLISLGLKGVKLHPDFQQFSMDGKKAEKLGEEIAAAGLPILVHTGDPRYSYSNPPQMKVFLEKFPEITVIAAHLGGWSVWDEAERLLSDIPGLYFDCCSCLGFMEPSRMRDLIRSYGAERIMWGTDYPMWDSDKEMEKFLALGLTNEEEELILYKNAAKLLGVTE